MDPNLPPVAPPITPAAPPIDPGPAPVAPPAPPMPPVNPAIPYQTGGVPESNGFKKFFSTVKLSDVVIMGLTFLTFFMVIDYYRKKLKSLRDEKVAKTELESKVSEIETNVKTFMGDNYKS